MLLGEVDLDKLDAMNAGMRSAVPHNDALGLEVVDIGDGEIWMKLPWAERLVGDPSTGVLHGGAVSSLMDAAAGFAVMVKLQKRLSITTLDLRIDYLKPASPRADVIAHTVCYKVTRHVCFVRGTGYVTSADDPIATVAATFARKT